ncbi:MAG: sugar transporter permease [Acidimicrobiaceae bacterium]|nr:sugar transporter permease [Acidimicrobiaceae bacterium]
MSDVTELEALATTVTAAAVRPQPPRPSAGARFRSSLDKKFYILAAMPALVVVTAIVAVPLVIGIYLSFTNYNPINPTFKWAGLVNYDAIIHNNQAVVAIQNTVIFAGAGIVIEVIIGLFFALMLARPMRGIGFFRTLFVLPLMVAGVASAVTWRVLLNTSNGWVNYFLSVIGLPQPNWLANAHTAMPSILIADAWSGVPIVAIICLAGLLALPKEPVEAARIDGASELRVLRHVTLPGLRPVLAFAVLFQLVNLFRQFAEFSIITGGGPGLATNVLNYYVWQTSFIFGELGLGAALAVVLVVVMAVPLVIVFKLSKRRD